jgi:hypothetical protein
MAGTLPPSLVELWRDCELICLARKRNLDTQLRQTGATGNSFLIFRNRVKSGIEKYSAFVLTQIRSITPFVSPD